MEVSRKGNPTASLDRNRAAPRHNPPQPIHSLPAHGSLDSRLRRSSSRTPFSRPRYALRSLIEVSFQSTSHRSLVHPSRDACSRSVGHAHKHAPGRWPGAARRKAPRKRTGSAATRERLYTATRGKADKRLASGLTLCNTLAQPVNTRQTNNLGATRGTAGKRLAVGFTLCNTLRQSPCLTLHA